MYTLLVSSGLEWHQKLQKKPGASLIQTFFKLHAGFVLVLEILESPGI